MNLLKSIKERITKIVDDTFYLDKELSMEKGSSISCKDICGKVINCIRIVPTHIDKESDDKINFPRFDIVSTIGKDGQYNIIRKHILSLNADETPTEGSKNLLTSGCIYNIISDLQNQIDALKDKINK